MKHYTFTFSDIDTLIILQALSSMQTTDNIGGLDKAEAHKISGQMRAEVVKQDKERTS